MLFRSVNESYFDANMRTARAVAWYFPAIAFMRVCGYAVLLYFGGRRVISDDLSFGTLVSLLIYLDWFFQPIINLSNTWNQMQSAGAAMAKLFASETGLEVCDGAARVLASYGYAEEYPVERHLRDVRFTLIGGGTSEILKLVIAKEICG